MLTNLYIAYGITWAIHLGYLGYLVNRFSRVKKAKSKF
ncbi:MAG: hypothetical protein JWO20_326 [Candidatus Angelobacter sp.]|jgi:hypothetical protein|nr:hypothetical protein [Candidatus Angelobacter sp.]